MVPAIKLCLNIGEFPCCMYCAPVLVQVYVTILSSNSIKKSNYFFTFILILMQLTLDFCKMSCKKKISSLNNFIKMSIKKIRSLVCFVCALKESPE